MTREELLEASALDAFGLLDEYEAALFTRSFHHAPAAVQSEIMQLQADLVTDEAFLTTENPDPVLRQRVLEAVSDAVERETAELAPLATIGRSRAAAVAGRFNGSAGHFWRAAAFVLAGAVIVIAYFFAQTAATHNEISVLALRNITDAQLEKLVGPTFKEFAFNPNSQKIHFARMNSNDACEATIYVIENSDQAFLLWDHLPAASGEAYLLRIRNADGETEAMTRFASDGGLSGTRLALGRLASELKNVTWEICDDAGSVLLTSI